VRDEDRGVTAASPAYPADGNSCCGAISGRAWPRAVNRASLVLSAWIIWA